MVKFTPHRFSEIAHDGQHDASDLPLQVFCIMFSHLKQSNIFSGTKCPSLWANGPDVQGFHNFPNKPAFNGPRTVNPPLLSSF